MRPDGHGRQVALFLIAVLIPCLVLAVLSLRMIRQERELSERRLAEERRRRASQAGQELLTHLERIKLEEIGALAAQADRPPKGPYRNAAVVVVAPLRDNRPVLPWEINRQAAEFGRLLSDPQFARRLEEGERQELVTRRHEEAAASYRRALEVARHPAQKAYAQLLLARLLVKSGRLEEAFPQYLQLLHFPSDVVDEQGVPLALYAAGRLLEAGVETKASLERIRAEVEGRQWPAPGASYMLRELVDTLARIAPGDAVAGLREKAAGRIRDLEHVLALGKDFPALLAAHPLAAREPEWIPHGEPLWLVGVAPPLVGQPATVVVVRAAEVTAGLRSGLSLSIARQVQGEWLGDNFPGLKAVFSAQAESEMAKQWGPPRQFYVLVLTLVLSVTVLGAWLLWRDVRRELRLAESRSRFVSSVSHELKTPLTSIRMFAETLRLGRTAEPAVQAEYLDTIVSECERLTQLVNNILDFSKMEQGRRVYSFEPASLEEIVHAAARIMQQSLAQKGFALQVDAEDGLPLVRVDRDALEQAILNLLANAAKYSGDALEIDLGLRREDGEAVIQVADRGVGIAPEHQARIFEPFYRVPTAENRRMPGTGLGLALVAHMAKAHGGRVELESAPGKGSTFYVRLPLEQKP